MSQLSQIYDIMKAAPGCKYSGTRHRGEFGVEIETETDTSYEYPSLKMWNTEKDNSLRDWGVEYILKQPMDIPDFEKALEEFNLCEKKYKFKNGSISTSVHVHINMLNETYLTLANFFTIYALMENPLIKYSGPDRLSNLFCLPMCDAEGVKDNITSILQAVSRNRFDRTSLSSERVKYGAINPAPLTKLGTVEIRCFRGETDIKIIQKWVEILKKIKDFSKSSGLTPPGILDMWKNNRVNLIDIVFQEYSVDVKMGESTEVLHQLIRKNVKYAVDFASSSKDWSKFGILKIKPVYQEKIRKPLEEISQSLFKVPFDSLPYHERLVVIERYHTGFPTTRIVDAEEDI